MRRNLILLLCSGLLLALPLFSTGPASAGPQGRLVYWVMVDLVRGSVQATATVCAQTNVFKHGEEVVWRARVLDVASSEDPGDGGKNLVAIQERGLKVTAYLENGLSLPLRYGQHPGRATPGAPVAWFWATGWKIPDDFPTGTLKWWVVVTDKTGAFVRFDPIGAGANLPAPSIIVERR